MATSSSEEGPAAAAGAGAISTAAAAPEVANGDGCDDVSNGEATPEQRSPSETGSKSLMERVQARVRNDPATDYREDIVRSIFGEVGTPVEDFSCAVESRILLHGRMYVTTSFVCFYSNLFGFEKIIKIPFCHMRCITKEKTALFIPNAIAIITSKKEYIFRSFWDREDAFKTLKQCQQHANGAAQSAHSAPAVRSPAAEAEGPSPSREGSLDLGSRESEDPEQTQTRRQSHHRRSSDSGGSGGSGGGDNELGEQDSRPSGASGARRRLPWSGKGDRQPPSSSVSVELEHDDRHHDHGLSVSGPSSNEASYASIKTPVRGSSGVATSPADNESPSVVALDPRPTSPAARLDEQTAEGSGGRGGGEGAAVVDGGGGGGSGAGLTLSDEGLESEVDVLGVEGSPVSAVSLGATTGGGKMSSKAKDFNAALEALGEGWLVASGEEQQQQPPPPPPDRKSGKGATARISTEVPCLLQDFFGLFISNDAEKGIPAFHESLGDSNVVATPWKVAGGALGMTREIRFVHPVSAPIGPNSTRAVKLQRCRLYDEHGLILETSTHLEDILMSDYFQIDDRCVVQPGQDGSAVRVDVEVEIKFFKSTMFRKTIETKSLSETRHVWESFIDMTKDAVRQRQPVLPLRSPSGGEESDDEDQIRATRERLRERRKHRNRTRHHPHHPHHPHSHDQEALPSRPRAKSAAASTIPPSTPVPPDTGASRTRGLSGVAVDRKRGHSSAASMGSVERKRGSSVGKNKKAEAEAGELGSGGSVLVTPVPSLRTWLFSVAAMPWLLLAIVFLVEAVEYSRFSSETAGFLEAAEAALAVLEGRGEGGAGPSGGAAAAATKAALKEELARGLVRIYSRHRFVWPFSRF